MLKRIIADTDVNLQLYPTYENTLLTFATQQNDIEVVECLLSHSKIDVEITDFCRGEKVSFAK
jgi:hypothetical protein